MKFRPVYIAIIFVLLVTVFMASSAGSSYVPYMKTSYFDHAYPYEGMSSYSSSPEVVDKSASSGVAGNTAPSTSVAGSYISWMSGFLSSSKEGFLPLSPGIYDSSEMIDRYGKTPGEPSCFGKSMGYSRSTGPLCFNDEDLKLLTTRGGNMGSRDSVIGQDFLK